VQKKKKKKEEGKGWVQLTASTNILMLLFTFFYGATAPSVSGLLIT
jgi:hypothetical protein